MNKNNIINLGDPENDNDAVNKKYVDNLVSGLQSKKEVCCSTIENIKCKYDNTEETLTINKKDYKKSLFDNINLNINDSILVLNQDNKYENGIYYLFNDKTKIVLKRRDDLNKNTEGNFNGYYVFCENGKLNGNTGFVLSIKEIVFGVTDIIFNKYSTTESYNFNNGLIMRNNSVNLNINHDLFEIDNYKLSLKDNSINNKYLKNNFIKFYLENGLISNNNTLKLGETLSLKLNINKNDFCFGSNNELCLNNIKESNKGKIFDSINCLGYINSSNKIETILQFYPPSNFNLEYEYSNDYYEGRKNKFINYFICSIDNMNKETHKTSSDKFYYPNNIESLYVKINWDMPNSIENISKFKLYRNYNGKYEYLIIDKHEIEIMDIIEPNTFNKNQWKKCDDININNNETSVVINSITNIGDNFITSGNLGLGLKEPKTKLHIVNNNEDKNYSILQIESKNIIK